VDPNLDPEGWNAVAQRIEDALAKWRDAERQLHIAVVGSPGWLDAVDDVARARALFYETVDEVATEMLAQERGTASEMVQVARPP
jgi:hypothetical protein